MATITGTSGNDNLTGTSGDDLIDGGNGIDTLSGNAGRDIFLFEGHSAAFASTGPDASRTDIITDFHHAEDWIQLSTPVGAVLHLPAAADFISALALANAALPVADTSRPGLDQDVAAVQVGSDTYIFWDEYGAGPDRRRGWLASRPTRSSPQISSIKPGYTSRFSVWSASA